MKRAIFVFLLISCMLACAFAPLRAQEKAYRDPGGAYSLSYPAYFECQPDEAKHMVTLLSKEKILSVAISAADAKSFPGSNIQKLCKDYPVIEQMIISAVEQQGLKVTSKDTCSFKGVPAITYGLGGNVKNTPLSGLWLTFINNKMMYMMFFFGREAQHEQNKAIFNTMLESFKM
jgi:hypothetical protein